MPGNSNLHDSHRNKTDEFYTDLRLIENELRHYREYFAGKSVLCNCDDPRVSNFFRYFVMNFKVLGLKKLVATCYKNDDADLFSILEEPKEHAVFLEYDGSIEYTGFEDFAKIPCKQMKGNGDFRSDECIEFLKEADIVVTNPPFSLFREYIAQLMQFEKKFLIIGNMNAITYKEILPLVIHNQIWLGYNSGHFWFQVPEHYEEKATDFKIVEGIKYRRMGNICWFTNLDIKKRHEKMDTGKKYSPEKYPKYDNYDAIEVGKTADIPMDYDGIMGVPVTFMDKYNPEQFEILGDSRYHDGQDFANDINFINGKGTFTRMLIRRRK